MHRNAAHASVITGPWQHPAPAAAAPRRPERRKAAPVQSADALRAGLTPAQLVTLEALLDTGADEGRARCPPLP